MISIKLLGGAKKSFGKDSLQADFDSVTISKLLEYLLSIKPENTLDLDTKNILIAVNGADSSALQGHDTVLKSGDVITIIPVIHGGARLQFSVGSKTGELFNIKHKKGENYDFLASLRKKFPKIIMEGISSNSISSVLHAKKIASLSLYAQKNNLLLAKKLESDILLRFAATTQISAAIKTVGIEQSDNFTIVAIGTKSALNSLNKALSDGIVFVKYSDNAKHIQKQFGITKKHLDVIDSKTPLEDLLAEKAAMLFQ
ncbi:MAG: thiamine biosynthesis protein ThiS [Nitrososphaeria archaeon]|nr:thiamine biosynthesis protein ThiS [Nitrososphaeria archaeon]NDB91260.1 thiamine biosynthesis protein ThiS [Nitrososphaeria archaeon]